MAFIFNPLSGQFDAVLNKAQEIQYLNATSGLTATQLQDAVDELAQMIADLPNPLTYKGIWDASTNTPTLANTDVGVEGFLYQVDVAGTVDFGAGNISFAVGDKVVSNGTEWQKWDLTDAVLSVNGETGIVLLDTDDIPESGTPTNLYFTDLRAQTALAADLATKVDKVTGDILRTQVAVTTSPTPADVTGALFAGTIRSFEMMIDAIGAAEYECIKIVGIQGASDWTISQSSTGDEAGVSFSITSAGQLQYISNQDLTLIFKANVLGA